MPRGKKGTGAPPDKYKGLSDEMRAKLDGAKDEAAINQIIADAAKYHAEMMELKEQDPHLKELREELTEAGKQYSDEAKAYKATLKYARALMESRGYNASGQAS